MITTILFPFFLQVSKENVIDLSPRNPGHTLTPSTSQLRLSLGEEHFTEEGETKIICKANILPISWQEGDEKVFGSSRKTELRSMTNTNTFNASPVILFDEDALLTCKFKGYLTSISINPDVWFRFFSIFVLWGELNLIYKCSRGFYWNRTDRKEPQEIYDPYYFWSRSFSIYIISLNFSKRG